MRIINIIWSVFVYIARFILFPVHFAIRFVVRIVLLVILVGIIIIPGVLTFVSVPEPLLDILERVNLNPETARVLAFFASLGGFTTLIKVFGTAISDSLSTIGRNLWKALKNEWIQWIPTLKVGEGLLATGQQIINTLPKIRETLKSSTMLALSAVIAWIVLILAYEHVEDSVEWQQDVTERLETLEQQQVKEESSFNKWQEAVTEMHKDNDTLEESPVVYSLVYPPQANLRTKVGICPDSKALEWLNLFKAAIVEYSQDRPRLHLEVKGFSSAAPVAAAGSYDQSNLSNCEIANERAEAVVGILTSDDSCENVLGDSKWQRRGDEPCIRRSKEFNFGSQEGLAFDVTYRPWQSYEEMTRDKPVNDGLSGSGPRSAIEFLNRGVQIIVKNNLR